MLSKLLIPLGIASGILMLFAVLTGLRVIRLRGRAHLRVHKALALIALAGSLVHAALAIYYTHFQ